MWTQRDFEGIKYVASLAESRLRVERVWNPSIGDLEKLRDPSNGSFDSAKYQMLHDGVHAIFYGYDFRDDAQRIAYYNQYKFEIYKHQLAYEVAMHVLYICHAALHPAWLAVLCFSRRTKPPTCEREIWPHPDWDPRMGVCLPGTDLQNLRVMKIFRYLEDLTEPHPMTTVDLVKRLKSLDIEADVKTVREAADCLGVTLLPGTRGPKSGPARARRAVCEQSLAPKRSPSDME